jgi:hypothetical protein
MTAWKDLPNAKHIDQVLADVKAHPDEFAVAYDAARDAAGGAARRAAWDAAGGAARRAAWDAAWDAARDAARDAAGLAVWVAAWYAMMALVAWDHSSKYLTMTYQELTMWYQLNEDPAALLLLPYLKAQELIAQKSMA